MPIIEVNNPVIDTTHYMTSPFGIRSMNGKKMMHNGIDIVGWNGKSTCSASVLAIADGKVIAEGYDLTKGNFIEIRHSTFVSVYYHLKDRSNKHVGELVERKERIGEMGNTGNSTGTHLHFGTKETTWVDPMSYLTGDVIMDEETVRKIAREEIKKAEEERAKDDSVSSWAYDSVMWSKERGIINGDENGNYMPKAFVTREQFATILHRIFKK